jgi:hypothetical protein
MEKRMTRSVTSSETTSAEGAHEALRIYITQIEARLEAKDVDGLGDLEAQADALREQLEMMPGKWSPEQQHDLDHLRTRLDRARAGMLSMQQEMSRTMASMNQQKRANRAYANRPPHTEA